MDKYFLSASGRKWGAACLVGMLVLAHSVVAQEKERIVAFEDSPIEIQPIVGPRVSVRSSEIRRAYLEYVSRNDEKLKSGGWVKALPELLISEIQPGVNGIQAWSLSIRTPNNIGLEAGTSTQAVFRVSESTVNTVWTYPFMVTRKPLTFGERFRVETATFDPQVYGEILTRKSILVLNLQEIDDPIFRATLTVTIRTKVEVDNYILPMTVALLNREGIELWLYPTR